jgi:hypothetical protein
MSPDFPPGVTPNFADPALQSDAPQLNILAFLEDLSDAWKPISPGTDADEMAVGVLLLADGIQTREAASGPEARLTVSGTRWKDILLANRHVPIRARHAVLMFVWDQYQKRRPTPPLAETPAPQANSGTTTANGEPPETPAEPPDLVTLDQAAALVNRSPAALRHYRSKGMPKPYIQGTKGKPNEFLWSEMRPWLESTFNRKIPHVSIQKFRSNPGK